MTDQLDTEAIRAQMEALAGLNAGPSFYHSDLPSVEPNWHVVTTDDNTRMLANVRIEPGSAMGVANASLIATTTDIHATILALCDAMDELRADNERLRRAAGVVSAVFQSERARLGGQPFTGNWSIPQIGFRGTVDDALDMADAALAQKGGE